MWIRAICWAIACNQVESLLLLLLVVVLLLLGILGIRELTYQLIPVPGADGLLLLLLLLW
jgi:hypothetical protein